MAASGDENYSNIKYVGMSLKYSECCSHSNSSVEKLALGRVRKHFEVDCKMCRTNFFHDKFHQRHVNDDTLTEM